MSYPVSSPALPSNYGLFSDATRNVSKSAWRALYHFNIYRLVLGGGFVSLGLSSATTANFGTRLPGLFLVCAIALICISLLTMVTINRSTPGFVIQASLQFIADIIIFSLMMHASGGINSGIGLLLVVTVAGSGVVMPGARTLGFASLATLAVFVESLMSWAGGYSDVIIAPRAAILGIALFATGTLVSKLAEKIRTAEHIADQQAHDLATLAQVNAQIVSQLDTGTMLIDARNRIQFSNEKARKLLGIDGSGAGASLDAFSERLAESANRWRIDKAADVPVLVLADHDARIAPRFLPGSTGRDRDGILVFLDDLTLTEEKAQQMKLASLGRLTAAISHEIRNPLSAINHASQLLEESTAIDDADRRLTRIIIDQGQRINSIIQSVLQFSRRSSFERQRIDLRSWCTARAEEYLASQGLAANTIVVDGQSAAIKANAGQIEQVLTNLWDNAIRHSGDGSRLPLVTTNLSHDDQGVARVDVVDQGSGISPEDEAHLFEPFFTTHSEGTGLGLYICRELCEANGATLNYIADELPGCRFRIEFVPGQE